MSEKITKKFIDISPHRSIFAKISQTGYSIQEALSELIDNAIDARLPGKEVLINVDVAPNKIVITDNGIGMNEEEIANAIRLGFSKKIEKLGEFGLGLKTATSFLGKNFTLTTTQKDSDEEYILKYDEEEWLKNGNWSKYPLTVVKGVDSQKSGTSVTIEKLKIELPEKLLKNIQEEFGIRFGPFIKNKEIKLILNQQVCKPIPLKIIEDKKNEFTFKFKNGKAWGWWGYQLSGLNKSYYGFHTYRRGRLVTTYDRIGLSPNQDILQIIGEVSIEGVPITHDKKGWLKSSINYKKLEKMMREYFKPFEKQPKRLLSGYPASQGKVVGTARLINMFMAGDMEKEMGRIRKGDIIVTAMTRPHFLLGIRRSQGIITDMGGNLSHAAIVAREFDIPAVVGTQRATSVLHDGQRIILDGYEGNIYEA